jgi:hypothetical protein
MSATLDLAGATVTLEVPNRIVDQVEAAFGHLAPGRVAAESAVRYRQVERDGGTHIVRADRLRPPVDADIGQTADDLIDDLHLTIALHSTDGVFVHAGVVGWRGAAIIVPGRSMTGKSTLVTALVKAGASYLSDEYAIIRPDGTVAPYPRPIQLRTADGGREVVDPESIGRVESGPLPPGLLLVTRFDESEPFDPVPMPQSAAALALFDNTVTARRRPNEALRATARVSRTAHAFESARPDAPSVADTIFDLVKAPR